MGNYYLLQKEYATGNYTIMLIIIISIDIFEVTILNSAMNLLLPQ